MHLLTVSRDLVRGPVWAGSWGKTRTADPNQLMDNMTKVRSARVGERVCAVGEKWVAMDGREGGPMDE